MMNGQWGCRHRSQTVPCLWNPGQFEAHDLNSFTAGQGLENSPVGFRPELSDHLPFAREVRVTVDKIALSRWEVPLYITGLYDVWSLAIRAQESLVYTLKCEFFLDEKIECLGSILRGVERMYRQQHRNQRVHSHIQNLTRVDIIIDMTAMLPDAFSNDVVIKVCRHEELHGVLEWMDQGWLSIQWGQAVY